MKHMTARGLTRAKLAELGDTADAIAAKLEELGVRGYTGEPRYCPLFNYLVTQGVPVSTVDRSHVNLTATYRPHVPLTPAQREFVTRFDAGQFPSVDAIAGVIL